MRGRGLKLGSLLVSDDLVIQRAEKSELDAIGELAGKLVRMHHAKDPERFLLVDQVEKGYAWWFSREIERREAVILVARRAERLVGYAYGTVEDRDWNRLLDTHGAIHDILVAEDARRRGVGRALLSEVVKALEELGAPRIVLSTMVDNEAAQSLFRDLGFRPTMLEMTRGHSPATGPTRKPSKLAT